MIPISLAQLTNPIVCVCAFLSNFEPALVLSPEMASEGDVDAYFQECGPDGSEASDVDNFIL